MGPWFFRPFPKGLKCQTILLPTSKRLFCSVIYQKRKLCRLPLVFANSSLKKGDFWERLSSLSRLRNDQLGKRSTFFSYCVFLRACVLNWLLIKPQPTASKSGNYATSVNNIVSFLFSVKWWLECCANDQSGKAWLLLCAFTSATKTSRYRQV